MYPYIFNVFDDTPREDPIARYIRLRAEPNDNPHAANHRVRLLYPDTIEYMENIKTAHDLRADRFDISERFIIENYATETSRARAVVYYCATTSNKIKMFLKLKFAF